MNLLKIITNKEILFVGFACFVGIIYITVKLFYQESLISVFLLLSSAMLFLRYFLGAKILLNKVKYRLNFSHQLLDIFLVFFLILSVRFVEPPFVWFCLIALTYFLASLKHHLILKEDKNPLIQKKRTLDILGGFIFAFLALALLLWGIAFEVSLMVLIFQIFSFIGLSFLKYAKA